VSESGVERIEEIAVTCPFCTSKAHTYPVEIETGVIMFFEFPGEREPEPRTFTRIFVCPDTGKKFQGEMTLLQQFDRPIESVTVKRAKGSEN
jgi:hypothetical protein